MKRYRYVVVGLVFLGLMATIIEPSFLTLQNLLNVLRQSSILFCLSVGLTGVVIAGHIDLSVGSVAALTGCICAKMMVAGCGIPQSVAIGLLIGLLVGFLDGALVGILDLPSFVASYGVNMVVSGIALLVMKGGVIYNLPESFTTLGIGHMGRIPIPLMVGILLLILMESLYSFTIFGRSVYMTGQNKMAALYSGIPYSKITILSFMICGLCASVGGIIMTARLNAADAGMCDAYGLQIIASVVVGGSSLMGGEGGIFGTMLGAMILTIIINIMNMIGVASAWQNFVLGVIIITLLLGNRMIEKMKILQR